MNNGVRRSNAELLRLAALACGFRWSSEVDRERKDLGVAGLWVYGVATLWDPITDNDQAFDLETRLGIKTRYLDGAISAGISQPIQAWLAHVDVPADGLTMRELLRATRLAIVMAAAVIGGEKGRPDSKVYAPPDLSGQPPTDIYPAQHQWNSDGERCEVCGDKDWFAGPVCCPPVSGHACRPEDRAMVATPAGQELVSCAEMKVYQKQNRSAV